MSDIMSDLMSDIQIDNVDMYGYGRRSALKHPQCDKSTVIFAE